MNGANDWDNVTTTVSGIASTEARTHDANHALVAKGSSTYTHDENGNRLTDATYTYEWDAFNRLRSVTETASGDLIAEYDYDALDRRIQKAVSNSGSLNGETSYVYDAEDVIAEYSGTTVMREFVHGPGYDEPLAMDRNLAPIIPDDTAIGAGDDRLYYIRDALGSIIALSDGSGEHVEGYLYEAYGEQYVVTPGANGDLDWGLDDQVEAYSQIDNPYSYTGQRFDAETGLMHYKARMYDVDAGRFISRDPIGTWEDQANLGAGYTYVGSNPLTMVDPTGLAMLVEECGAAFGYGVSAFHVTDLDTGESHSYWSPHLGTPNAGCGVYIDSGNDWPTSPGGGWSCSAFGWLSFGADIVPNDFVGPLEVGVERAVEIRGLPCSASYGPMYRLDLFSRTESYAAPPAGGVNTSPCTTYPSYSFESQWWLQSQSPWYQDPTASLDGCPHGVLAAGTYQAPSFYDPPPAAPPTKAPRPQDDPNNPRYRNPGGGRGQYSPYDTSPSYDPFGTWTGRN